MQSDKWKYYNPNPDHRRAGDCTVRAICKATGKTWDDVYTSICVTGGVLHDMPSANHVWGAFLKKSGFKRYLIEEKVDVFTVEDFCRYNPKGTYILCIEGHVVCVQDGYFYDTWDSSQEIPIYFWTKEK